MKIDLSRRGVMKASLSGLAVSVGTAALSSSSSQAASIDLPEFKVAGYNYDRVRGIVDGDVGLPGARLSFDFQDIYALNQSAFGPARNYAITEIGLIPYITKFINEDFRAYTLVPVFISRMFRHRNIYVHVDAGIQRPEDLRGKRIGVPGYGSSSNTWIRGFLLDEYGVRPDEMQWIETTKSSDQGSVGGGGFNAFDGDESPYFFPEDFPLVQGPPGVDESELLLSEGCDALITPITPQAFLEGRPEIRELFADARATEKNYFRKTGLFPIMHAVAIRKDVIAANPALPRAVVEVYEAAKQIAYTNLQTTTSLKVTLPWATQEFEDTRELMGEDFWPYGIEANRPELEAVMRYTYEQGLVREQRPFEELFHPSTLAT